MSSLIQSHQVFFSVPLSNFFILQRHTALDTDGIISASNVSRTHQPTLRGSTNFVAAKVLIRLFHNKRRSELSNKTPERMVYDRAKTRLQTVARFSLP